MFRVFVYYISAVKNELATAGKIIERFNKEMKQLTKKLGNANYELDRVQAGHDKEYNIIGPAYLKMRSHVKIDQFDDLEHDEILQSQGGAVKGLVCNLFDVKDAKYTKALIVSANPQLFGLVVDNINGSLDVINKWLATYSTPIIPNKIANLPMPLEVRQLATELVGVENVIHALECITYDASVENTMQWVFGETFICKDADTVVKVSN